MFDFSEARHRFDEKINLLAKGGMQYVTRVNRLNRLPANYNGPGPHYANEG